MFRNCRRRLVSQPHAGLKSLPRSGLRGLAVKRTHRSRREGVVDWSDRSTSRDTHRPFWRRRGSHMSAQGEVDSLWQGNAALGDTSVPVKPGKAREEGRQPSRSVVFAGPPDQSRLSRNCGVIHVALFSRWYLGDCPGNDSVAPYSVTRLAVSLDPMQPAVGKCHAPLLAMNMSWLTQLSDDKPWPSRDAAVAGHVWHWPFGGPPRCGASG